MARMKQTRDDVSGTAQSRIATTPVDRLRVAVRIPTRTMTADAQTKLHTMFEDMLQEYEQTKESLERTKDALIAANYKLDATETELDTTKSQLAEVKSNHDKYSRWWREDFRALNAQKRTNEQLVIELAIEKEKAQKNNDAQEKLEQLQKQWSSLSHILSNEDTSR
ncbi:uncharacterized protein J4E92_003221 [Alternaria infectoria]|uniref:uncharacterized protein n=1 Tax=Alternaria infectoria TaxID=45303 RepID=UPI002220F342|nr:uncharacterized protein J4E92_003221 [Alternaria infectoria]KAI4933554.1 hypothetical protein J4E92_003221 [Alternaria infectoria]